MRETLGHPEGYFIPNDEEDLYLGPEIAGYDFGKEDRYRIGIPRIVIDTASDLSHLQKVLSLPFDATFKINVARVVIAEAMLQHPTPELQEILTEDLEAIMPLADSGNTPLADCYFVSFSRNDTDWQTPKHVIDAQLQYAQEIYAREAANPRFQDIIDPFLPRFDFVQLQEDSPAALFKGYNRLAKALDISLSRKELVGDTDTVYIVAVDKKTKAVAGGAFAAVDNLHFKRKGNDVSLRNYEVTGAVVDQEHYAGQSLYRGILGSILLNLGQRKELVHLSYGYSNVADPRVLKTGAQVGRTLVTESAGQLGLRIAHPAMAQNSVNGVPANDIVSYISGNQLRARAA